MSQRRSLVILGLLAALVVGACRGADGPASPGQPTAAPTQAPSVAPTSDPSLPPTALTVGLGYIPSVQFAQFYLADQAGYYREAGLEVTFQNKIDPDLITLVGQGAIDIGIADGTSMIPAVSQGIPVRYVATVYGRFPSIVFGKASSGVDEPADLEGKRLGIPGRYGSSWIMLQALLASAGLTPEDLEIVEYPDFGQGAAVAQGAVDVATGFANNEPVQLALSGEPVTILRVDDITPLPGPGLVTGVATLETKREALAAFVAATLRAMDDITADPELGLDAAIAAVPELASARETQAAILAATIESWRGPRQDAHGLGALDADAWHQSIEYLESLGLVPNVIVAEDVISFDLLQMGG
ncbi:MAG: ABC transporter substrate-binding protein [Candidatus Limnocylindria bacterium]